MNNRELIEKAKEKYKKLGSIECPAFYKERVYFNSHGLQHLVFKGRFPRLSEEVLNRFNLLFTSYKILAKIKTIDFEEKRIKAKSTAYFWTIKTKIGSQNIRIILRRVNDGLLHFFSIMDE